MKSFWKEIEMAEFKGAKIIWHHNVSQIFNDVDYYVLSDKTGNFIAKDIDFNKLHRILWGAT